MITDNNPKLGEQPFLIYKAGEFDSGKSCMKKEGKYYTAPISVGFLEPHEDVIYHIDYQDTKKIDNNKGKEYCINPSLLLQKALIETRKQYRQPLVQAINSGTTVGKIFIKDKFSSFDSVDDINEPTIIVAKTFHSQLGNPNVVGLILTSFDLGALSHMGTQFRNNTDVCAAVYDAKYIEQLKQYNGKNVELSISDDEFRIKETKKEAKPIEYPKVSIPEQKYCNKILTPNEYSFDIVGAKAVNLKRLSQLVQTGKIDVKVPQSIAIPHAWVQKLFDENGLPKEYCADIEDKMNELMQAMKANYIDTGARYVMVRSSFNGEDLAEYSAAGLYTSEMANITPQGLYEAIIGVVQSKWADEAIHSRKQFNIPDDVVKPTVILQDYINSDYKFTVYTDFNDKNKVRVEILSGSFIEASDAISPHVFEYDKKTKELTYKSIQMLSPSISFDESLQKITLEPIDDDLAGKLEVLEMVNKLIQTALVIEKEFASPQDIEGGFVGKDIYLWQTRNIVK